MQRIFAVKIALRFFVGEKKRGHLILDKSAYYALSNYLLPKLNETECHFKALGTLRAAS
jgi:hypothetical protein